MNNPSQMTHVDEKWPGTFRSYLFGFLLSILLTVAAYLLVVEQLLTRQTLVFTIVGIGIVQALAQLVLFLHLGQESRPRWNLIIFLFMALTLFILVGGSLWIMYNLNERVMPSMDMGM